MDYSLDYQSTVILTDLILSINHLIERPPATFLLLLLSVNHYITFSYLNMTGSMQNGSAERRFGTLAVHAGAPHDPTTGAVIAPVCLHFQKDQEEC